MSSKRVVVLAMAIIVLEMILFVIAKEKYIVQQHGPYAPGSEVMVGECDARHLPDEIVVSWKNDNGMAVVFEPIQDRHIAVVDLPSYRGATISRYVAGTFYNVPYIRISGEDYLIFPDCTVVLDTDG